MSQDCYNDIIAMYDNPLTPLIPEEKREHVFTVTEITRRIKGTLETNFFDVWVVGEVSNLRRPSSGHIYLTLKDENAQMQGVIFRNTGSRLRFELKDGMGILVRGSISVYEPRGQYQIKIEEVEPRGIGTLQLAFQQLKEKLEKEGLFDPGHKKPIPFLPQNIAIVTSPTGAAIKDMVNIINRRFPGVQIFLYPVKVQGDGAADEIAQAIYEINRMADIEVIIVGRGGGSIEDLWAFNEEIVARSIYASQIPVISAVGHEIDVTIADFVADKRALTPSEAGEMVVPRQDLLIDMLNKNKARLTQGLQNKLILAKNRLRSIANSYAFRKPLDNVLNLHQRLDDIIQRMGMRIKHILENDEKRLSNIVKRLDSLSPLRILSRGYSITTRFDDGSPIKSAKQLKRGEKIKTTLYEGYMVSVIEEAGLALE